MSDPHNVALWGPSSAGKTAFLAQLYLRHSESDWEVFPTPHSLKFLEQVEPYISGSRFPPATVVSDNPARVAYIFKNKRSHNEIALFVEDRAGKESEDLTEEGKKHFNEARGLILLFDPDRERRMLERHIEQTLTRLSVASGRGTTKDERPIAICLSKADLLIKTPSDLKRAIEKPREFVLEKIADELVQWLDRFCSNYQLFPISSVGIRLSHGVVEPVVFYDENLTLRLGCDGIPINLMKPFEWLFDRITSGENVTV